MELRKDKMPKIRILVPSYTLPNVGSVISMYFENLLPVLKKKVVVQLLWLFYHPNKLNSFPKFSDITVKDIHDSKNAIELLQNEKPDIVFAFADQHLVDYAVASAAKFLDIPVVSFMQINLEKSSKKQLIGSYITSFFESTTPAEMTPKKQFMKRGRFFLYKYGFLLRTQLAMKMSIFEIIQDFLFLLKVYFSLPLNRSAIHSHFANTFHLLENKKVIRPLIERGFEKSSLVVTGNPIYDPILKKYHELKLYSKHSEKINVLFAPTPLYEHGIWTKQQQDEAIREIVKCFCKHKNEIKLVVKIHPSTGILSDYESIINSIDPSIPIHKKGDILDYLEKSDVVISFLSSSHLIKSVILRKPIIICNFYGDWKDSLLEEELAVECKDPLQLFTLIQQVLSSNPISEKKREKFIDDFLFKSDGLASERVCDLILKIVKKKA